ncbi:monocarboxylate transporter [Fusarium mexicanum]|uniref:Monocarboxylate transporter n=1 Tax=Fusarium mexicanum TaxID=751941 RepID=A0A8H5JPM7_9HYPO|nr:monocarboxylate transporter [Fusarium mexicanum]
MAASIQATDTRTSWATGLLKVPLPPRHLISTRKFLAQSINAFFQSAAYYTPIFYIAAFSKTLGYNETDGANFTALSNACNAIGKVGVGFIADRIGRLDSLFLTTLLSCTSTAGLWVSSTVLGSSDIEAGRALFIAFTVMYGLFASAYTGLFSPALVELFGISEMPHITGIMYMFQGAAGLMGTPLAGLLVTEDTGPGSYLYMAVLVGSFMFISAISVQWARIELMVERAGGKWQWTWGL